MGMLAVDIAIHRGANCQGKRYRMYCDLQAQCQASYCQAADDGDETGVELGGIPTAYVI